MPLNNICRHVKISTICFVTIVVIYFLLSKIIFDNVYLTSNMVVDEEFHIALGQAYCNLNFTIWDPKVTTLPGLYLVSTAILAPFGKCTTYWLRMTSLLASVVNLLLFYDLQRNGHTSSDWRKISTALVLALLPPMYFFCHVYYTDVVSLMMVVAMLALSKREYHYIASIFGLYACACRQTNIVWVVFVLGHLSLGEFHKIAMHRHIPSGVDQCAVADKHFFYFMKKLWRHPILIPMNISIQYLLDLFSYGSIVITFIVFVISNRGIVVGDQNAHEVSIHIPQLFYFSVFCLVFAWPYFVEEILNFLVFARRHKLLTLAFLAVCFYIVHVNTLVHPYLLADNRHYVFYLWNRFYGQYDFFRYLMVPVYVFAWYAIVKMLYNKNDIRFFILYMVCIFSVLVPQKLLDLRYYFIPYIIFRLNIRYNNTSVFNVVLEFVTYCVMNAITFNLFFTKPIIWTDYEIPQRLIW